MTQQKNVEERSLEAVGIAIKFEIKTNEQNLMAAEKLKAVQLLQKEVSNTFDSIIDKAHKTHKEAIEKKNQFALPLKQAEMTYKKKIALFCEAQDAERKKEEDKLREQAEKKEAKLREKADKAIKDGDEKKAEKLIEKAEEIPIPTVAPKYEKPKNVIFTMRYRVEIQNRYLIPRVFSGMDLLIPNEKAINKLATASKGTIQIPGISITAEKTVGGRTV